MRKGSLGKHPLGEISNRGGGNELNRAVAGVNSTAELGQLLGLIRGELPFEHLVYHSLPLGHSVSARSVQLLTYSPEWVSRYVSEDYFSTDPVVQGSRSNFWPFEWSAGDYSGGPARNFFLDAVRHGVGRRGIVIPVSDESGRRAVFSATSQHSAREWESITWGEIKLVFGLAGSVHRKVLEIDGGAAPCLTLGEKDCLRGLLHGLTPKQVAGELGVSESRVRFLVQRAVGKLGCDTAIQGVVAAATMGLIA